MSDAPDLSRLDDIDEPDFAELGNLTDDVTPNPVDMVVFDVGGVLLNWHPRAALVAAVGDEAADAFLDDTDLDFWARNREADAGRGWAETAKAIAESHPHHASAASAYVENFADAIAEPIAGSVAILRELSDADVPLFAVTNFSADLFEIARERHEFLELFEEIVVSGEEGVMKPDPEIWEILEEVTRHVGGLSDAVFIDDTSENVMSAEQAGIDALLFTDADTLRDELLLRGLPLRPLTRN